MSAPLDPLTPRETEILDLLDRGTTTADLASQLFISVSTVRNHIGAIMAKLGAHSRLEAVAIQRGEKAATQVRPTPVMDIVAWLLAHDVYLNDTLLGELWTDFGQVATTPRQLAS